ncbi:MAG: hypothetical protein K4304_09935 [Propionicimonas sp.]
MVITELRTAWERLLPGQSTLGQELLEAWSAPTRRYHDLTHLSECLTALELLDGGHRAEYLALWFHDSVHTNQPGVDEQRSADLAQLRLDGIVPADELDEVVRLIRLTVDHDPHPEDAPGARVCDADLAVLGAEPSRYAASVADLREELSNLSAAQWRDRRRTRVEQLLATHPLFHSPEAQRLWGEQALTNLTTELRQLQSSRHIC